MLQYRLSCARISTMKTILVSSIKGGVGKTTISVGIAKALRRRGLGVGILDLDYRAPCVPIALESNDAKVSHGRGDTLIPPRVQDLVVMSMAYVWPADKCVMVEDADAVEDVRQLLTPGLIAWPEDVEYLVIDTPPTSSGIVTTALSTHVDGAVLVSHPSRFSKADLIRTLDLFAEKEVPVYALVSNQGTDLNGQNRFDLTDDDLSILATERHIPFFIAIPHITNQVLLGPFFDSLVQGLLTVTPVVLPKKVVSDDIWRKVVSAARKLNDSR